MKKKSNNYYSNKLTAILLAGIFLYMSSCTTPQKKEIQGQGTTLTPLSTKDYQTVYQLSTIKALMNGLYDEAFTFGELKKHGDFGMGTFNKLDGEMILLDGVFYQIKDDGKTYSVPDIGKTPFATITNFKADTTFSINEDLNYKELSQYLERLMPSENFFYAIKIEGEFKYARTRSVSAQQKPYPNLLEVTKDQRTFDFQNVEGTIVALWSPDYVKELNVPGFHFHFITKDLKAGGHLLGVQTKKVKVQMDYKSAYHIELPKAGEFLKTDLKKDQQKAIEKVEKEKKR
ncbi:acetolactate decarboxylase [Xanthovirga aplysinae]|uniref:acetolactate decarboxylase n=1 Tax=Xanthovirga aplysinae TaxID=2529853 RepID=UPI0012BCD9CE|nr:acetolactate decarboxylase [Xanthovirga aplysinae]MTI31479.1 acetolactate decarboxylase [Xanthovirga aplysinae]